VGGQKNFFARSAREIVPPTFKTVAPPLLAAKVLSAKTKARNLLTGRSLGGRWVALQATHFYTQKQLLLSARLSHYNSVCLSVSHTGGSGKNGAS